MAERYVHRWLVAVAVMPFLVACGGPGAPRGVSPAPPAAAPAPAAVVAQPAAQPAAVAAQPAAQPAAVAPAGGATAAPELGRQFVQALIAGDAGGANALLSDSGRRRLEAKTPEYARALAACAGTAMDVSVRQDQAMTNVFTQFAPPCGRFGDIAHLQVGGTEMPADAKIALCLVAFRTVNSALRVENFVCTPA